jgi:hypothetical protein
LRSLPIGEDFAGTGRVRRRPEPITHLAAAEEYAASLGDKLAEGVDE